eukprot:gnl/TRDRNA2_/TRDRNA2_120855_c3_seq1.p1 gnl/TRDRNA2_/TRDRNA2_120855_c3~~gnl/TRDRNA2_/TRDRNA2_120855_c3_seq1.p1  ORF type:complete len:260 (-),score=34.78 gnl/TRDRNA2_/TRDRNA2_120855_c3_seq1:67-846(-)
MRNSIGAEGNRVYVIDLLPIRVANITFQFGETTIKFSNVMSFKQGHLVAVLGRRREGKSLLLRVLGGAVLPTLDTGSDFFIPAHLRVLHVPVEKMFIHACLFENLLFGVDHVCDPTAGTRERVADIVRALGMRQDILDLVYSDETYHWGDVLSQTQRSQLCLARALVANPEMLVLHKPTEGFDEISSHFILHLLDDFKRNKGVGFEEDKFEFRRPRTVVMSSSKMVGVALTVTDKFFHVSKDEGIVELDRNDLSHHLLT